MLLLRLHSSGRAVCEGRGEMGRVCVCAWKIKTSAGWWSVMDGRGEEQWPKFRSCYWYVSILRVSLEQHIEMNQSQQQEFERDSEENCCFAFLKVCNTVSAVYDLKCTVVVVKLSKCDIYRVLFWKSWDVLMWLWCTTSCPDSICSVCKVHRCFGIW